MQIGHLHTRPQDLRCDFAGFAVVGLMNVIVATADGEMRTRISNALNDTITGG